jgi:copper(I)-binding protein
MIRSVPRRTLMRAGLVLCLPFVAPATRACEVLVGGFRILHPWTRATAADATSAVLCMTFDGLIAVETPVAEGAEMGGLAAAPTVDFPIPVGQESVLGEGGTFVRLVGLKHPLQVGRSYPLRLGFENAGAVPATLNVDFGRFR